MVLLQVHVDYHGVHDHEVDRRLTAARNELQQHIWVFLESASQREYVRTHLVHLVPLLVRVDHVGVHDHELDRLLKAAGNELEHHTWVFLESARQRGYVRTHFGLFGAAAGARGPRGCT